MPDDVLIVARAEPVCVLTLNRPDRRNALDTGLRDAITAALEAIEADDAIRVAVITGAGPVFCAGFDRSEFATRPPAEIFAGESSRRYHHRLQQFSKPLIAAVNGSALGGGMDITSMADIRIAANTATFGQPQVKFGAGAMFGQLAAVIGGGRAAELCLTGRTIDAEEALRIGFVTRVVPVERLMEEALAVARGIAEAPLATLAGVKASIVASGVTVGGAR
jgi:enoyl-CoA hydratase